MTKAKRSTAERQLLKRKVWAFVFCAQGAWHFYSAGDAVALSGKWWVGMVAGPLVFLLGMSVYGDWRVLRYIASPQNDNDDIAVRGHEEKVRAYQARVRKRVQKMEAKAR